MSKSGNEVEDLEKKYENCISLGWFCGTASSMEQYGLRSHSGPFDWYFSDFESVLKMIETDFSDFMKKENLVVDQDNSKVFHDIKYGFCCNHDISGDFETEYPQIYRKYMRRVERFLCDVHKPTCFIRAVRSEEEIQYIEENQNYIHRVIKNGNSGNEIVFLLLKDMRELSSNSNFLWFRLGVTEYIGKPYEMRTMFESSDSFSKFCRENILSDEVIKRNIEFDREHSYINYRYTILVNKLIEESCDIIPVLKEYYLDLEESGVYLWGMGTYGVPMVQYLLKNRINVNGIIDNDTDKIGTFCYNIPVIAFSEVVQDSPNIFISVRSEQSVDEIMRQIATRYPNIKVYKIADLLKHPMVLNML